MTDSVRVTFNNIAPESRIRLSILHKVLKKTHAEMFDEMMEAYWNVYKDTLATDSFPFKKIDNLTESVLKIYADKAPRRRKNAQRQDGTRNRRDWELRDQIRRDVPPVPIPESD